MKKWWIGCSGFYYKGWKGAFYPEKLPQRNWFEYYCQYFNTVELNVTFYRFPRLADLQGWFKRSPDDFRFTVKAPRLITHYKKFNNTTRETRDFYNTVSNGLEEKLGSILFQLHPRIEYSEENLSRMLDTLDTAFTNAIEFRHPSWWRDDVYKTLKAHNITFCGISYPDLPDPVVKTASAVYYRFHGVPQLYLSSYTNRQLQHVTNELKRFRSVTDVYCYFNNDIEVAAVRNAKSLQRLAEGVRSQEPGVRRRQIKE
jgi:uncharacterized protein YecE (DUF72 family)